MNNADKSGLSFGKQESSNSKKSDMGQDGSF
jgi:hypothetical protein